MSAYTESPGDATGPWPETGPPTGHYCIGLGPDGGMDEGDLDGIIARYAEDTLDLARHVGDDPYDIDDTVWHGVHSGAYAPMTVHDSVTPRTIAQKLEEKMYDEVKETPVEFLRSVAEDAKADLAQIGLGVGATTAGYTTLEPPEGNVVAAVSTPYIGMGLKGLNDKFGPESLIEGAVEAVKYREMPAREVHQNLIDNVMDDLYLVDIQYRDRDLGEVDTIVENEGLAGLERRGLMAPQAFWQLSLQDEDELDVPCKFYALVLDQSKKKRDLRMIANMYTDETLEDEDDVLGTGFVHAVDDLLEPGPDEGGVPPAAGPA